MAAGIRVQDSGCVGPWSLVLGPRAGVSLLEVLISIFVIMVGLLGIAAVIPVGRYTMVEIAKADRSGACGRAATRDVKVRAMVDPYQWLQPSYAAFPNLSFTPVCVKGTSDYLPYGESFAIDPLFIARSQLTYPASTPPANRPSPDWFPYSPPYPAVPPGFTPAWPLQMRRVTLARIASADWAVHRAVFDRMFTWQDDLAIPVPRDPAERPRQMMFCTDGSGYALPDPSVTASPLHAQNQGDYTWMAVVSPAVTETGVFSGGPPPTDSSLAARQRWSYTVSVVVWYKRDFALPADLSSEEQPPERMVTANLASAGWGGGDVKLTAPLANPGWLNVRENQWLMLCGTTWRFGSPVPVRVYRWYRIVAADAEAAREPLAAPTRWARWVTLAGPDWSPTWCARNPAGNLIDTDNDGTALDAAAVICDGVIGVYTTTMELDAQRQAAISGP